MLDDDDDDECRAHTSRPRNPNLGCRIVLCERVLSHLFITSGLRCLRHHHHRRHHHHHFHFYGNGGGSILTRETECRAEPSERCRLGVTSIPLCFRAPIARVRVSECVCGFTIPKRNVNRGRDGWMESGEGVVVNGGDSCPSCSSFEFCFDFLFLLGTNFVLRRIDRKDLETLESSFRLFNITFGFYGLGVGKI